jgi:iron complex outermembrane receptor protein
LRIAGSFDQRGGWIDEPSANQNNFNTQNRADVRTEALLQAADNLSVNAMAIVHRNRESVNQGDYPGTGDTYTQIFGQQTVPLVNDDYELYNLTVSFDLGSVQLLNTTTNFDQRKDTQNYGYLLPIDTTIYGVYVNPDLWHTHGFTEELRASSEGNDPWQWTLGGFYRRYRWDESLSYNFGLPSSPLPEPADTFPYDDLSYSYAAFGDTSYRLFDRLTIGAGLRYFIDHQDYSTGVPQTGRFHSLDPRFYAQFKVSDEMNVYASAAKGFRTGGFNAQNEPTYQPEEVWTYEAGVKSASPDHHLNTELTGFFSNYTNYQTSGIPNPSDPINITSNAGSVQIKGAEWSLSLMPLESWTVGTNGNYTHAVFTHLYATSTAYEVGDYLDFVPRYQFGGYVQHDFALANHKATIRMDYDEMARQTQRNRSLGPLYFYESNVIHSLDLHADLAWNSNLSVGLFAQNLLNQHGFSDPLQDRIRPLTAGFNLKALFE